MTDKERLNEARHEFERAIDEHIERHGRNARIYISGPMTGLERREYLRNFYQAEERLRRAGYRNIVNPARLAPCRWPWLYRLIGYWWTIRYDLFWLKRCDMIYKLDGWQTSRGALIESAKAEKRNIKTLEL